MRIASGLPVSFSSILKSALPLLGALVLTFSSCRPQDEIIGAGSRDDGDRNTLAIGLATVPAQFSDVQAVGGLSSPVAMDFAPDGRLFICQKNGNLRVVKNGSLLAASFLFVNVDQYQERGLLGVAFDPDFATEKWVYVYYTATSPAVHNRVSRFLVSSTNPDLAAAGSEQVLFDLPNLGAGIHNGGAIHFGGDGKLYIATGENSVPGNSQDLNSVLGKLLRINKDYSGSPGLPSIPTDNPFYGTVSGNNRAIWARGLRNPFTFAVQPGTGRIFINDVGQATWEEIDEGVRGANYGWSTSEGPTSDPAFRSPYHYFGHGGGVNLGCSIIGAAWYNPAAQQFPAGYVGDYFYGDFCNGYINQFDPGTGPGAGTVTNLATNIGAEKLVDIKVGPEGALYYLLIDGSVRKISYTGSNAPVISQHPASRTVSVGQSTTFDVTASGSAPLAYQWQRNEANIAGATGASYTLASPQTADNNARFRVMVSNSAGTATSNNAVLTVTTNNPPTATITAPAPGATYYGGMGINYAGSASDPEQGSLPASAFSWKVDFHHDAHSHPVIPATPGSTTGSFTAAARGETSPNVFYRITLTVTDAGGLASTVTRDVQPITATITLNSSPSGLQVKLDGAPVITPFAFTGVAGMIRSIEAVSPQTAQGQNWAFTSWNHGGSAFQEISTPSANTAYAANFAASAWTSLDVGAVGPAGSFSISGATHSLSGSGADIWGTVDAFRFAYQTLNGDGQLTARIASLTNTDPWAKAGVMIRENTAAGSRHAFMAMTTGNGAAFQRRETTNGQSLHTGAAGAFPHWVRLVRTGNSLKGYRSTDGATWTLAGESVQALPAGVLIGLAVTSHNNGVLATGVFDNVSLVSGPPPVTWTAQDVGTVGLAGSTTGTGTLTMKGSGADIYGTADGFHYYHRSLNADGEIRARVASMTNTDQWAKAGVMIRENTAAGSRHVFMGATPTNGLEFVRRETTGGTTFPVGTPGGAPRWVRVTRVGNVFTAYNSADGTAWTQVGTATVTMGADVRVGLAVCSHNNAVLNTAMFDNVAVTD